MQWNYLHILKLNSGDIDKSTVGWLYLIENNDEILYWWCISHLSHSSVQVHLAQLLPGIMLFILFIANLSLQKLTCSMQFSTSAHALCNSLRVLWVYTKRRLVYYPWSQWNFQCSNAEFCLSPTKIDESVIVPHQSALYGYHVINGDVAQCLWGHMWLWFWSGVACSWTVAVISGFVALWCVVVGVGSIIGVDSGGCGGRNLMCKLKDEIACTWWSHLK